MKARAGAEASPAEMDVEITPAELKFRFQLNKQLPAAISIHNPSNERQAFKVKTTTPKKYVVRPSSGVVEPKCTANVQVIMQVGAMPKCACCTHGCWYHLQAQKEFPVDIVNCKDKFLVQVKRLEAGEEITPDTFKSPKGVRDTKIRVVLDGPPAPPSPVPEVNELDEDSMRTCPAGDGFAAAAATGPAAAGLGASGQSAGVDVVSVSHEHRALRAQLERVTGERDMLRGKLDKVSRAGGNIGSSSAAAARPTTLPSVILMLVVGILAFVLGHYLQLKK